MALHCLYLFDLSMVAWETGDGLAQGLGGRIPGQELTESVEKQQTRKWATWRLWRQLTALVGDLGPCMGPVNL